MLYADLYLSEVSRYKSDGVYLQFELIGKGATDSTIRD